VIKDHLSDGELAAHKALMPSFIEAKKNSENKVSFYRGNLVVNGKKVIPKASGEA